MKQQMQLVQEANEIERKGPIHHALSVCFHAKREEIKYPWYVGHI